MVIVNAILYLSSVWYSILSYNHFLIKILPYWFLTKNIRNCRKYNIFFNFRFTENMIFPSIAENPENMIFTLSMFTKMLFFMHILIFLIILHFVIFSRIEKNAFFYFLLKYSEKLIHWDCLIKLILAEGALRNNITEMRRISNIMKYMCLTLRYVDPDFLFGIFSYLN